MDNTLKLGKTPARPGSVQFKLSQYAQLSTLPTPPAKFGHQRLVANWDVLGNDKYGDCVFAGAGHETMLWNKEANRDVAFTDACVLSDYSAVTGFNPADPSTDNGTDMQVAASYRRKTGVVDAQGSRHKVAAYLAISPGNRDELKVATYLFSAVGIGFKFPKSAMGQFNAGLPWVIISRSPIVGGHYVSVVGYDSRYIYVVTWGKIQKMSWGFYSHYADEAVAYVSDEMLTNGKSLDGFDVNQLEADLGQLK